MLLIFSELLQIGAFAVFIGAANSFTATHSVIDLDPNVSFCWGSSQSLKVSPNGAECWTMKIISLLPQLIELRKRERETESAVQL